jgi:signal transduction histidine kinase
MGSVAKAPRIVTPRGAARTERTSMGRACIAVRWGGQVLGVLVVYSACPLQQPDVELLHLFAAHAAAALRNARVVHSLQDLSELKDAVIGLAAHDLRGPLTHITGYLGLLTEGLRPLDAHRARWLGIIEQSVERMSELIEGILTYRRLGVAEMMTQNRCDLSQLAADAAAELRGAASEKSQTLEVETSQHDLPMTGDATLLRQALLNLLSNAIKYTPPGGCIRMRTKASGGECRVTVQDTGPGIAPEDHDRVFQPFVRLTADRSKDGLGLGLSLVKTIVERHGGCVSLTSRVGEGATFVLRLPVERHPPEEGAQFHPGTGTPTSHPI